MYNLTLNSSAKNAWRDFLANRFNLGHAKRVLVGGDIESHVNDGLKSVRATVARVRSDLGELSPRIILEIGCSAGLNCLALQEAFPDAEVIGIEPEQEALCAAESLRNGWTGRWPQFVRGIGESIPLSNHSVDLILCHTVIEHVQSVPQTIAEMARVLSPCGIAHLEAPNYLWPYEPHLEVWTIPMLGKNFVRMCARLQGRGSVASFLEHLQFVTPFQLERIFTRNNLAWHNRTGDKIRAVLAGHGEVKQYKSVSRLLGLLGSGLADPVAFGILASGMYPSVLYSFRHGSMNEPD
ncbi:MAG: class I SAM-dependent methyltransferase [Desulfobulbia bacterium]|jgi:ubiquinone/menaquinone biosynthesis C-methylase UbiE